MPLSLGNHTSQYAYSNKHRAVTSLLCMLVISCVSLMAQDLTEGLLVNDLQLHPMQPVAKPSYLGTITDPSFGTTIRRITDAGAGHKIVPMYSTIQAWNTDESKMILYDVDNAVHLLLDGMEYTHIRNLTDINPADLEQIFWDFEDPDIFYYPEATTDDFIKYNVALQTKTIVVNMDDISDCSEDIAMGNDIQMMSWDSDVFTWRCGNSSAYAYRISTGEVTVFDMSDVAYTAPMPSPSGIRYYHQTQGYDTDGNLSVMLNESSTEHACEGRLSNGNDAHFAVAFADGPDGGCGGNLVAHDMTDGTCYSMISEDLGYDYSQSGTHISALAYKNVTPGWLCASLIGYDQDGQQLLDQELVIALADADNIQVCRIGHHRSDEDEYDYWGEPHAVISPTGTRVLFGSDWSGADDGHSVDSYVVELPAFATATSHVITEVNAINIYPNPFTDQVVIGGELANYEIKVVDLVGNIVVDYTGVDGPLIIDLEALGVGLYFLSIQSTVDAHLSVYKIIKE